MTDDEDRKEELLEELESVHDPEIPVNIVDLGLIYETEFDDDHVDIEMTLTSMGCPTADSIVREVELTSEQVDGIESADVELVWQPPWTPEKVSDDGKAQLSAMGINI
jgi:metal-sulfur cluster biosynthetic enzyme